MIRKISLHLAWLLAFPVSLLFPFPTNAALDSNDLKIGQKFEVVGEIYAHRVYHDLNTRVVSIIILERVRLSGPEIESRKQVPIGSIVTVLEKAPKRLFSFLYPDRYIVRVSSIDAPAQIPVVIDLSRGLEGQTTVLNPLFFKPLF